MQSCLNAPEPAAENQNGVEGEDPGHSPEDVAHQQVPQPQANVPRNGGMPPYTALTPEQQQQMVYQQYLQQQQQGVGGNYPMPPQVKYEGI